MAGRRPLPTAIHELNGFPGKRKLNRTLTRPQNPRLDSTTAHLISKR